MRKFLAVGILASVMFYMSSATYAQRPFFGANPGGMSLLMNKGVQEELKVTDEQKEKMAEKARGMFGKYQEVFGKLKDVPAEERQEKVQKLMKEINDAATKEMGEILKPEQMKRLKQIERQQNVANTISTDEDVINELKANEDLRNKMKSINDESTKEIAQLFQQFNKDNPRETQEKVSAARKEANERAVKALSDDQQKKWKELIGDAFEVKLEGGFGGAFLKKNLKK